MTDPSADTEAAATDLTLDAAGHRLAARWLGPSAESAPTLVFLHEGLGSIGQRMLEHAAGHAGDSHDP